MVRSLGSQEGLSEASTVWPEAVGAGKPGRRDSLSRPLGDCGRGGWEEEGRGCKPGGGLTGR